MRRARPTTALLFATVVVYSDLYIPQPILPLLSRAFGVPPATAGLLISVVVLAIALSSSIHGTLSDRLGRRPVMVASCTLLAIPTLLCAFAPGFGSLMAFRALQGLLIPGVTAVAVAWIGDEFPPAAVGRQVGLWIAASVAGGLLGRVASGPVAERWGWHAPFVLFGVLTLAGAAALARALPRSEPGGPALSRRREPAAPEGRDGGRVTVGSNAGGLRLPFRDKRLVGAFLVGAAVFFGFIGIFTYLPYRLTAAPFFLSTAAVSSIYFVYVSGIFTSLGAERLARRIGAPRVMALGFVVAGCGVLLTGLRSVAGIVFALVVLCVGMFLVQAIAPAYVNRTAAAAKGAAGALYVAFYYVGATFGAFLPGRALQAWGWPGVIASCLAAFLAGLLADLVLCRGPAGGAAPPTAAPPPGA